MVEKITGSFKAPFSLCFLRNFETIIAIASFPGQPSLSMNPTESGMSCSGPDFILVCSFLVINRVGEAGMGSLSNKGQFKRPSSARPL